MVNGARSMVRLVGPLASPSPVQVAQEFLPGFRRPINGIRHWADRLAGIPDDVELAVGPDLTDADNLPGVQALWIKINDAFRGVAALAANRFEDVLGADRSFFEPAGVFHRLLP